jgi:hypothetical protein
MPSRCRLIPLLAQRPGQRGIPPTLRDWLLTCPTTPYVSAIAADAAQAGLLDLPDAAARAIAIAVRLSYIAPKLRLNRSRAKHIHHHVERLLLRRGRACELEVVGDTLVLIGAIGPGVAISGSRRWAELHVRADVPHTVVTAMKGRGLDEIFGSRPLPFERYTVARAELDDRRVRVRCAMPRMPLALALATVAISRECEAQGDPDPAPRR